MWRALAVVRGLALLYALIANLIDLPNVRSPGLLLVTLGAMVVWTAVTTYLYPRRPAGRWLLICDLAMSALTILATLLVESRERVLAGEPTIPMVWAAAAVLAAAIRGGVRGGLLGAGVLAAADLVEGQAYRIGDWADLMPGGTEGVALRFGALDNIVLVFLAAMTVGYLARVATRGERAMADAIRLRAATQERERLSRTIHDGVLQVLALVQRRATEIGGPAVELGRLAGEQEVALRTLMTSRIAAEEGGLSDLTGVLAVARPAEGGPAVRLSAPAEPVLLPAPVAAEVAAAVGAALDNVAVHVGRDAPAWVLVEGEPGEVVVTIRDDGPGFAAGRLAEAAEAGRIGVSRCVLGRMADIGGRAVITSAPGQGTEVELHVPR
jgi:signal transduction histidine kinase